MSKLVIGLVGVKTSGKSTVAEMIKDRFPEAEEGALANKLKNVSAEMAGVPREHFDRQDLKEVPFDKPRVLTLGSIVDILRAFNVNHMSEEEIAKKYEGIIGMLLHTPREVAQIIGTEVLREAGDEDIHCKNLIMDSDISIVSDVRFPNEYTYFNEKVENLKFIPLYIQRDEAEKYVTPESHASERLVFDFCNGCIKVGNNGSLEDLENNLEPIFTLVDIYKENSKTEKESA